MSTSSDGNVSGAYPGKLDEIPAHTALPEPVVSEVCIALKPELPELSPREALVNGLYAAVVALLAIFVGLAVAQLVHRVFWTSEFHDDYIVGWTMGLMSIPVLAAAGVLIFIARRISKGR